MRSSYRLRSWAIVDGVVWRKVHSLSHTFKQGHVGLAALANFGYFQKDRENIQVYLHVGRISAKLGRQLQR